MNGFTPFPKIARYSRDCTVTEKIDGTNAQIVIASLYDTSVGSSPPHAYLLHESPTGLGVFAGSRNRYLTLADDDFGFARWVAENAEALVALGPGRHFGEWWGSGIQRGYGLPPGERRLSLFNVRRWCAAGEAPLLLSAGEPAGSPDRFQSVLPAVPGLGLVPVLARDVPFDRVDDGESVGDAWVEILKYHGSYAAPGFADPEGIVIHHSAANVLFKKTIHDDASPKGATV